MRFGKVEEELPVEADGVASMRPQIFICGKETASVTPDCGLKSFNEATDFHLWKGWNILVPAIGVVPSMRPQIFICGKSERMPQTRPPPSHFNEATDFHLWKVSGNVGDGNFGDDIGLQ